MSKHVKLIAALALAGSTLGIAAPAVAHLASDTRTHEVVVADGPDDIGSIGGGGETEMIGSIGGGEPT